MMSSTSNLCVNSSLCKPFQQWRRQITELLTAKLLRKTVFVPVLGSCYVASVIQCTLKRVGRTPRDSLSIK